MTWIAGTALTVSAICSLFVTGYFLLLTMMSRRLRSPPPVAPSLRFDLVVPAHQEEANIGSTVASLLAVHYPTELRRVLVVADNCSDRSAAVARAAGALVVERHDLERRGKGYALASAFQRSLSDGFADAVVVVDADTVASPNLLTALSAHLVAGAQAVQVHYGVRNPAASWRTRLMAIAFCLFHRVRSLGRERLGVSAGLRGNGMCFRLSLLGRVPHEAHSLVEDVEYGIRLGLAGCRVHYADEATVFGEMVSGERGARSQRHRWEHGRRVVARTYARPLLGAVVHSSRPLVALDLLLDVMIPPLSTIACVTGAGLLASAILTLGAGGATAPLVLWAASAAFLGAYVGRGVWLSGMGSRGVVALLCAPLFVVWKLMLPWLQGGGGETWVRTTRELAADRHPAGPAPQVMAGEPQIYRVPMIAQPPVNYPEDTRPTR